MLNRLKEIGLVTAKDKYSLDKLADWTGRVVDLIPQGGNPVTGTVLEALADGRGIITKIKLARLDGKVTWYEVGDISIVILEGLAKWLPGIWAWVRRRFTKDKK